MQLPLRWMGAMVNVWLAQDAATGAWTLIDCGPPGFGPRLATAVEAAIGTPPEAILITHGHFDHVGGLDALLARWSVPVYAHEAEIPYLTGAKTYTDLQSKDRTYNLLACLVPQLRFPEVEFLPLESSFQGMEVHHVPGHSPGMVALLHPEDKVCIAADTFRFKPFGNMPLFTYDRALARESMRLVVGLEFEHILTTHSPAKERGRSKRFVA